MGLDIYFCKYSDHPTNERIPMEQEEVGYFRKVNFLVRFFTNKGFDVEHQTPLCFDEDTAKELLDLCNQVLEDHSKAKELLPTMDGFFFGSTKYDEYYFRDVEEVKNWIEDKLLPMFDNLRDDEHIEFSTWY